ncbi:hypothetical protein KC573_03975, partial [candidate division WWE3 bacterium]|nr:hypothetical protein [candidate division WWE3 bacterium]
EIDYIQTLEGDFVEEETPSHSYSDLISAVKNLKVNRGIKVKLLTHIRLAEDLHRKVDWSLFKKLEQKALKNLLQTLKGYNKRGMITEEEFIGLENIINYLQQNI